MLFKDFQINEILCLVRQEKGCLFQKYDRDIMFPARKSQSNSQGFNGTVALQRVLADHNNNATRHKSDPQTTR